MNDKPELELLIDIAKLLKKYGPETFEILAERLSNPDFSESLVSILAKTAKANKTLTTSKTSTSTKRSRRRDFRSSLMELGKTDPEKSELLLKFYTKLIAKSVLPTLRDIRSFASDRSPQSIKAMSRDKAIIPLIKILLPKPLDELKDLLSEITPVSELDDRSLEGWSNIILNKNRRSRQVE